MVAESPIHFECVHVQTLRLARGLLGDSGLTDLVIGRVVAIHISDDVIDERGQVDARKVRPLARMGYHEYAAISETFELHIKGAGEALMAGLGGEIS
jgi:flavin reductase (DIM6/NTAB) family NADH-FMN oxidoreductase RutF